MAILFELWAECGDEPGRDALLRHVDGFEHVLSTTGRAVRWTARPEPDPLALTAVPSGVSTSGVRRLGDALESTECGLRLYHLLRTAPGFRYASVGWEAGNIPASELHDFVERDATGRSRLFLDCVLDAALYAELGEPESFVPFVDDYWWHPYGGEVYRPLNSADQADLTMLKRELFPELFRW